MRGRIRARRPGQSRAHTRSPRPGYRNRFFSSRAYQAFLRPLEGGIAAALLIEKSGRLVERLFQFLLCVLHRFDSALEQQIGLLDVGRAAISCRKAGGLGYRRFGGNSFLARTRIILRELADAPIEIPGRLFLCPRLLLDRKSLLDFRIVGCDKLIELLGTAVSFLPRPYPALPTTPPHSRHTTP